MKTLLVVLALIVVKVIFDVVCYVVIMKYCRKLGLMTDSLVVWDKTGYVTKTPSKTINAIMKLRRFEWVLGREIFSKIMLAFFTVKDKVFK